MKHFITFFIFSLIILNAKDVIEKGYYCNINWTKYKLTCKGESASNQNEFAAKRVAVVEAKRNMLERIKGVHITSKTTINNLMEKDYILQTVEGTIRGARVKDIKYDPIQKKAIAYVEIDLIDDIIVKLLKTTKVSFWKRVLEPFLLHAAEYNVEELNTLYKLIHDFENTNNQKAVKFLKNIVNKIKENQKFTGLIINAKEISNFKCAIFPKIRDFQGKEIYPSKYLTTKTILSYHGAVLYDSSLNSALTNKRVTSLPLIVKAKSTYGNNNSDLLLDKKSSILINNINKNILKNAKIIIVVKNDE